MLDVVYSYRGPMGAFEGSWGQVYQMAVHHPEQTLIWREGWEEWKPFVDVSDAVDEECKLVAPKSYRVPRRGIEYWYIGHL